MKMRLLAAVTAAMMVSPAWAQEVPEVSEGLIDALIGPSSAVQGLTRVPEAGSLKPVVDGLVGPSSPLLSGPVLADGLHDVLSGLLVNQDPAQVQAGLEDVVANDLLGQGGLLEKALTGVGAPNGGLPGLPTGGAGLPGLGDSAPLSPDQLAQLQDLL